MVLSLDEAELLLDSVTRLSDGKFERLTGRLVRTLKHHHTPLIVQSFDPLGRHAASLNTAIIGVFFAVSPMQPRLRLARTAGRFPRPRYTIYQQNYSVPWARTRL